MKLEELLRHVANNAEKGLPAGHGLCFRAKKCTTHKAHNLRWDLPEDYTLSPNEVLVNGIVVERGVTDTLDDKTAYFTPNISGMDVVIARVWDSNDYDYHRLQKGLVFLSKEKAEAMANALLNFQDIE